MNFNQFLLRKVLWFLLLMMMMMGDVFNLLNCSLLFFITFEVNFLLSPAVEAHSQLVYLQLGWMFRKK